MNIDDTECLFDLFSGTSYTSNNLIYILGTVTGLYDTKKTML